MAVKLECITLRQIRLPLVHFFETSFGRTTERHIILVEAQGEERIVYPSDIGRIRSEQPGRAREIQKINGEKFQRAFERGLAVTGFERSGTEGTYLLEPGA